MMRQILFIFLLFGCYSLTAQVGVGTVTPDPSSQLDISATDKGVLIPRVSLTDVATTMIDGVNTAATGLLIYNTNPATTGGSGAGYYYFNSLTWERLTTSATNDDDRDWYEEGTTTSPDAITDDIYTQGNVAIGKTTADYSLDIENDDSERGINILNGGTDNGNRSGLYTTITNTGDGDHYGVDNDLQGTGTGVKYGVRNTLQGASAGFQYGVSNVLNNSGAGPRFGVDNEISGAGNGNHFGIRNNLSGSGTGSKYGVSNTIDSDANNSQYGVFSNFTGDGSSAQYGVFNQIFNSGNGLHYGLGNLLGGTGNGNRYGLQNSLIGSGTGDQVGVSNQIGNTGAGVRKGILNEFTGVSDADAYGIDNQMSGLGDGIQTGVETTINNSGSGSHYGIYNNLSGSGSGIQIGMRNQMTNSSNTTHIGSYNLMFGSGDGSHTGFRADVSGVGDGLKTGISATISGSGNSNHFGTYNTLSGGGSGEHFGTRNLLTGTGTGNQYSVYNSISNSEDAIHYGVRNLLSGSGNGIHYGSSNTLQGIGNGDKYGSYNLLDPTAGGTHYGVYSAALKPGSFAGYFLGDVQISTLAGTGNRMVIANAAGLVGTQAIPPSGDITSVTAGDGLIGGGTAGAVTLNVVAINGLTDNANDVRLGGALIQTTTISNGANNLNIDLTGTGDFNVQDAGVNHFTVSDAGDTSFGGDVYWRDENTGSTILGQFIDDDNDGRFIVQENGIISVDLDANTQFIFNEQGLDRNFRVESNDEDNMFFVDGALDNIGIKTDTPERNLQVNIDRYTATGGDGGISINQSYTGNEWTLYTSQSSNYLGFFYNNTLRGTINSVNGTYTPFSDRRFKKNIEDLTPVLDKILQIQPRKYHIKDQSDTAQKSIGVIAQEIEKIFPEVVHTMGDDTNGMGIVNPKTVSYTDLVPVLIKGMQEQQEKIDALENEINEIKALLKAQK